MTPDLEERLPTTLWRLADEVTAPPTDEAWQRVHRRTATLRRRRQARRAAVGTLLVAAVLGTGLWLRTGDRDDLQTGDPAEEPTGPVEWNGEWEPPMGDPSRTPALTVDAAGLRPVSAQDRVDLSEERWQYDGSRLQVFRRPHDYNGPTVRVRVTVDPRVGYCGTPSGPDVESVDVNGHAAWLVPGEDSPSICWHGEAMGTGEVSVTSLGLTADELVDFARGLRPRAGVVGFDATILPQGIVEDPVDQPPAIPDRAREVTFQYDDGTQVQIWIVHNAGKMAYEQEIRPSGEQVVVAGRPAFLVDAPPPRGPGEPPGDDAPGPWTLSWRITTLDYAVVTINHRDAPPDNDDGSLAPDRATVDAIIAGIHEITEEEWQALIEDLPSDAP